MQLPNLDVVTNPYKAQVNNHLYCFSVGRLLFQLCRKPVFSPSQSVIAEVEDHVQLEEDRVIQLFQETSSSVVFIKDLEIVKNPKSFDGVEKIDGENARVEGTGTGVFSGVNFAISIDTAVRTIPYLTVYETPYSDRY